MKSGTHNAAGVPYQFMLEPIHAGVGWVWEQDYSYSGSGLAILSDSS